MRFLPIVATFGVCVLTHDSLAQVASVNALSIPAGTEARIMVSGAPQEHYLRLTVLGTDADSLRYHLHQQADARALPWEGVSRMDVSTGRHTHIGAGLAIGLLTGVALGALIGSSSASGNDGFTPSAVGAMGAIGGGLVGLVGGAIVGFALRTDGWAPVSVPQQRR